MFQKIKECPAFPYDPTVGLYQTIQIYPMPLYYGSWEEENGAWRESCTIFAGLYPINSVARISGPDATRLLSDFTTTSYESFAPGRMKHTMMCDDQGRILTHGMIVRVGEQDYIGYTLTPYLNFSNTKVSYDVTFEDRTFTEFNFQCTGPRILETLEAASGECLHDIPFMGHRKGSLCGHEVRFMRMGMSGTLGYEVHGHIDHAHEIYDAIVAAGKKFGLKRIGWMSYVALSNEGGFQQEQGTFHGAYTVDPGYLEFLTGLGHDIDVWPGKPTFAGSSGPDRDKRFRNPLELGWKNSVSFTKPNYRGKAALQREAAHPTRRGVTLIYNVDDIMEIQRSLFESGRQPYKIMELPIDNLFRQAGQRYIYQDDVLLNGKVVGYANGRVYSPHTRDMSSMAVVDVEHTRIGTELAVLWGEPGARQKEIRAVVAPFPRVLTQSNSTLDVASIACIKGR